MARPSASLAALCVVALSSCADAAAAASLRKQRGMSAASAVANPAFPVQLMATAQQCKCQFSGLCSCEAAVALMDCVADACASGDCACEPSHFLNTCQSMSAACPSDEIHCSQEKVVCMHEPSPGNETAEELVSRLSTLRERQCKLQRAADSGYINAKRRLEELEPIIQGHLDLLKKTGHPNPVYMGCGPEPTSANVTISWRGGQAVPIETARPATAAAPVAASLASPAASEKASAKGVDADKVGDSWLNSDVRRFRIIAATVAIYLVLIIAVAFFYDMVRMKTKFPQAAEPGDPDLGFQYGFFSCFQDLRISALACCCPIVRWADSMDKADDHGYGEFLSYWHAVLMMTFLLGLHLYIGAAALHPFTGYLFYALIAAIGVYFRQKLRRNFDFPAGSMRIYIEDCLKWFCCPCCAVVQEARQVEAAL